MANGLGDELPEEQSSLMKHPVALAAGAAPFMGVIGQKRIQHDPTMGAKGKKFQSMSELGRSAQTGDILLTTKPKGSFWKSTIAPISGSEFYHVQPIMGRRGGQGLTSDTGDLYEGSVRHMREQTKPVSSSMRKAYPDVVLLRPKKKMTPRQLKVFQEEALRRSAQEYSPSKAVVSWAKDMFMPKVKGVTDRGQQTICQGNICSTTPSQAMYEATGKTVVPGKRPQDIFPSDFLRSDDYELVGSRLPNAKKYMKTPGWARRATPFASRAGMGAYMAATAYGTEKDPALLGAGIGGAAASVGGTALAHKLLGGDKARAALPGIKELSEFAMIFGTDKNTPKHFVTRRIPLTALGGLGGYFGSKALINKFKRDRGEATDG